MRVNKIGLLSSKSLKNEDVIELFNNNGAQCFSSDLSRIMGIQFNNTGYGYYYIEGALHHRDSFKYVTSEGKIAEQYNKTRMGVRICISFDDIEDFDMKDIYSISLKYPLTAISGIFGKTIEKLFNDKSKIIIKTGRKHDIDGILYDEYEVFGIKFIKIRNKSTRKMMSDGTFVEKDDDVFLEVKDIPFIVDEDAGLIYSATTLYALSYPEKGRLYNVNSLLNDLNNNFLKSINDELEHDEKTILFNDLCQLRKNRYNFDFSELTEEEIVEICINSNIAVFLHGKTGTGKTERMVSLDRDLELVDFGCTSSDGFTGIVAKDFNSKELFLYEPYWYKNLCEKCEKKPNKIHILFLEELTNAKNDIQKVAFEVTLNKTLTNSGFRLKLPENAVVCAAGNEADESKSANVLSEPLFGRFAHVYIDTDSEAWLKWASQRKKEGKELIYRKHEMHDTIHPAIVDFIRINGDTVLRTQYNGATPNADPRKWALASKALHECNNPNVLRAFVGPEVAKSFVEFCKLDLITVDDVLNDRCDVKDVPNDPSLRWYTTICLSVVDDDNVNKVREFVGGLGKEFLAQFDYEWSKDNPERIMKLYSQSNSSFEKRLIPNGNNK